MKDEDEQLRARFAETMKRAREAKRKWVEEAPGQEEEARELARDLMKTVVQPALKAVSKESEQPAVVENPHVREIACTLSTLMPPERETVLGPRRLIFAVDVAVRPHRLYFSIRAELFKGLGGQQPPDSSGRRNQDFPVKSCQHDEVREWLANQIDLLLEWAVNQPS